MSRGGATAPAALPLFLIFFLLPLVFLFIGISVGRALGFTPAETILLFYAILIGSAVNIPIYERMVKVKSQPRTINILGIEYRLPDWMRKRSIVAINVGGCLIPLIISAYFLPGIPLLQTMIVVASVTVVCYYLARPVPNVGIAVPMMAPVVVTIVAAWLTCTLLGGIEDLARISFTAGVLGTILGADLLHIRDLGDCTARVVSIGGAGTFDGIFLTGVLATLFSSLIA